MHFTGPFTLEDAGEREWLLTNGLGGYASATLCGMLTRRYHGLLVAALHPPGNRHVLVAKLEETLRRDGQAVPLATNAYPGALYPDGYRRLREVVYDGGQVVMHFAAGEMALEKCIWMVPGDNTTCVRYRNLGTVPYDLELTPLVNARDFHGESAAGSIPFDVSSAGWGDGIQLHLRPSWMRDGFWMYAEAGAWHDDPVWYHDMVYRWETRRGLGDRDNHFSPGHLLASLGPGDDFTVTLTTQPQGRTPIAELPRAPARDAGEPEEITLLRHAAATFLVERQTVTGAEIARGRTVIAGYHWFGDWGRDTMIALPGLCLTTGRAEDAAAILRTFAAARRHGLLPNVFSDSGEGGAYNAVDASLWFVYAVDRYVRAAGDRALVEELRPALEAIIHAYRDGTDYGIRMAPDGLIVADAPGWQLTWMDAKVGDWVVTPRAGKPVEVNALWYHALRVMEVYARDLGWPNPYGALAEQARESFSAFWYAEGGYLYDVLGDAPDARLRPNQLFAVSLPHSPLDYPRARAVVEAVTRHLLTPYGLRTLAPDDPAYRGQYGGDQWSRDGAYHQGTVWAWLIGPYVEAYLRVHGHTAEAKAGGRALLQPLLAHLRDAGIGSISEIFDGDPPHAPNGAISQAWSVAEVLRAWELCRA
ncbi:MAG TPA: amylo-alpha-1,6-glucosidase [Armatimonadota bacterium]|nr:amylo-alpha-1,6-glucosidase [Armatimonadota bacterium]